MNILTSLNFAAAVEWKALTSTMKGVLGDEFTDVMEYLSIFNANVDEFHLHELSRLQKDMYIYMSRAYE